MSNEIPLLPENRLIVSLFDYTGEWAKPYIEAGYPVMLWDYKCEGCILQHFSWLCIRIDEAIEAGYIPYGILSAPPCTDFSSAGAQYWPKKDSKEADEPYAPWTITEYSEALVMIVIELKARYPWVFWVIENPPGRLEQRVPELKPYRKMMFSPFHYGDAYTKKTILWGEFNTNLARNDVAPNLVPIKAGGTKKPRVYMGSDLWAKTGGGSEKNRALRSKTPAGFATAFFNANR